MSTKIEEFVLDDNKTYMTKGSASYKGKDYYLLMDESDFSNIKICYRDFDANAFIQTTDGEILKNVLPLLEEISGKITASQYTEESN